MAIDGARWGEDPTQEALRLLSSAPRRAEWAKLAALHRVPRDLREDAVHAAILDVAMECPEWSGEELGLDALERRLVQRVGAAIHNWQRRERRTEARREVLDDGRDLRPTPGPSRALRRKVLQLHLVGDARALTEGEIGLLLLEIGRVRLSLAQLRASENHSEKQALPRRRGHAGVRRRPLLSGHHARARGAARRLPPGVRPLPSGRGRRGGGAGRRAAAGGLLPALHRVAPLRRGRPPRAGRAQATGRRPAPAPRRRHEVTTRPPSTSG